MVKFMQLNIIQPLNIMLMTDFQTIFNLKSRGYRRLQQLGISFLIKGNTKVKSGSIKILKRKKIQNNFYPLKFSREGKTM